MNALQRKRVLLAAMSLDIGGAETHVITLARELGRRGYRVSVVSQGGRLVAGLEASGIPHHYARLHSRSPLALFDAVRAVSRLIRLERPAVLHAHARIPAWVCRTASRGTGTPLVTTYHGVYAAGFPWNLVTEPGDITVAVSNDVANHFVSRLGFDPARVRVIPNGIDVMRFRPGLDAEEARARHGVAGSPVVLHASRLSGEFADTALSLVSAMPELRGAHRLVQLVIAGDGDRLPEVRRRAEEVNAAAGEGGPPGPEAPPPVLVIGAHEDMPSVYALADIVVGVARVALEAMSCGKPVILAGEGGFSGLLDEHMMDEAAARNFTARGSGRIATPAAIADELRRALGEPSLLDRLGAAGREIAAGRYSIERMVDGIEAVYEEALRAAGGMRCDDH